jgi:[ribosomal protein S5]-alanine N-acetyltransferase
MLRATMTMRATTILESTLTCPHCGHVAMERMPTDACIYFYECDACHTLHRPKTGDCCVFCSYGSVKCPPIQEARGCCASSAKSTPMDALATTRLDLEPLVVAHADAMFDVLCEPALYRYLDHAPPPSIEHVRDTYAQRQTRTSPDGSQQWLNWIIRPRDGEPIGYVQATVMPDRSAWVAYVLSSIQWHRGYATEALLAMIDHLAAAHDVTCFLAMVEMDNDASIRLLERADFHAATAIELEGRDLTPSERLFVRK